MATTMTWPGSGAALMFRPGWRRLPRRAFCRGSGGSLRAERKRVALTSINIPLAVALFGEAVRKARSA